MKNNQILASITQKFCFILFLITLPFPVFSQEVEDVLPESFYGNWVEDYAECGADSYFSILDSEVGLLVFGLGWSSTEVKVEKMGDYYVLFVDAVSEGGDFQSEIKVKMGDDGNLFFIDSDSEEKELVKCDPTEFFEYESEEMTVGDEVEELDLSNSIDMGSLDSELPPHFFGDWVEDYAQCEVAAILSIVASEEGVVVSSLDWYSSEVMVKNKGDFYTLLIKGFSEEGDFETEINVKMGEDGSLICSFPESEEIKLMKCNLDGDVQYMEVEMDIEEIELVDTLLAVEEFDMVQFVDSDSITLELLQGKWQSLEDEASFMVIEGDRMKNYYGGMDEELDNEAIMLSDTCMNEADSANGLPEEKNRYLSNPNLDMCWYIEFVDDTSLSLIYMSTGNTLTYRRIQ